MKANFKKLLFLAFLANPMVPFASPNPATQDWVLQHLYLSADDWKAVCSTGSPTSSAGCYGSASSTAFTRISNATGGFTTYANINATHAPNGSVFIKAFLGGTSNVPVNSRYLTVQVHNSAARCALFSQVGLGLGPQGISSSSPSSGGTSGSTPPPEAAVIVAINNASSTNEIFYTGSGSISPIVIQNPIYLLCVGYNATDGSTAASILHNVTAT